MVATVSGARRLVRVLLDRGANVNHQERVVRTDRRWLSGLSSASC